MFDFTLSENTDQSEPAICCIVSVIVELSSSIRSLSFISLNCSSLTPWRKMRMTAHRTDIPTSFPPGRQLRNTVCLLRTCSVVLSLRRLSNFQAIASIFCSPCFIACNAQFCDTARCHSTARASSCVVWILEGLSANAQSMDLTSCFPDTFTSSSILATIPLHEPRGTHVRCQQLQ